MTTSKQNAPGVRTGGAQDEQQCGRVVVPSIRRPPAVSASLYAPCGRLTLVKTARTYRPGGTR
jgi:hypothetical protein